MVLIYYKRKVLLTGWWPRKTRQLNRVFVAVTCVLLWCFSNSLVCLIYLSNYSYVTVYLCAMCGLCSCGAVLSCFDAGLLPCELQAQLAGCCDSGLSSRFLIVSVACLFVFICYCIIGYPTSATGYPTPAPVFGQKMW